jgi:hypothetical protein
MLTVYSDDHRRQNGRAELLPCRECPERVERILARGCAVDLGPIAPPQDCGRPTLFVREGGDAVEAVAVNALTGFEQAARTR